MDIDSLVPKIANRFAWYPAPDGKSCRKLSSITLNWRHCYRDPHSFVSSMIPVEQWDRKGTWVPRATLEDIGELPREGDDNAMDGLLGEEVES